MPLSSMHVRCSGLTDGKQQLSYSKVLFSWTAFHRCFYRHYIQIKQYQVKNSSFFGILTVFCHLNVDYVFRAKNKGKKQTVSVYSWIFLPDEQGSALSRCANTTEIHISSLSDTALEPSHVEFQLTNKCCLVFEGAACSSAIVSDCIIFQGNLPQEFLLTVGATGLKNPVPEFGAKGKQKKNPKNKTHILKEHRDSTMLKVSVLQFLPVLFLC